MYHDDDSEDRVIAGVHPVHAMNAEQRQTVADLWTLHEVYIEQFLHRAISAGYPS